MEVNDLISSIKTIAKNQRETCLVIARSNKLLAQARDMMKASGIKAEIVSRNQDFASPPGQFIHYSLKLANSPDSRSLINKLCAAATLMNGITFSAEEVVAKAKVEGMTTLRAFFILASSISDDLKTLSELGQKLLCDSLVYQRFVDESFHLFDELNGSEEKDNAYPDYDDDKVNWHKNSTEIYRKHEKNVSLHVFMQEMDLSPKAKILSKDCVRLQTVHTAKGVEFKNVFVIGLVEDQFPTYFAIKNGDMTIQEERRNCFVAITRTSKHLYLSYAKSYNGWNKSPSRFLKEMGLINN